MFNRRSTRILQTTRPVELLEPKVQVVKQRVYAHDLWAQNDPNAFEEALREYQANNPDVALNVGTRRSLTIDFFRQVPETEQQKYRQMATDTLERQ
jgi:hypothetical protein